METNSDELSFVTFCSIYSNEIVWKLTFFGKEFCVQTISLVHTVNGISRQGLNREWTRQAGLSFYSKPMQTEWIVATVQREFIFMATQKGLWLKQKNS